MDSKLLTKVTLAVTLFAAFVCVLMLGINGYLTKKPVKEKEVATTVSSGQLEEDGMVKGADLTAWMNDETFFDEKKSDTIEKMEQRANTLTLLGTSIEKDLRVYILDANGDKVSGVPFCVQIEGLGTYQDKDRDGIIYVEDVRPGKYLIELKETEEYRMPEEPLLVEVKNQIEYRVMEDISYLIKTEDEIDAKAEDTSVNDAALQSEGGTAPITEEGAAFGIDVSKWNKEINWKEVKSAGVKFAMIRAGYRGSASGCLVEDPYFRKNMEEAAENGIETGVYFFTQATSEKEAVEEASMVLSLIQAYQLDYPVIIDSEGAGGKGRADALKPAERSRICEAFCETIRSAGYTAGVYASKNWFLNQLDITKFSEGNVIWLAEYGDAPTYGGKYSMWQYTSSGRLPGIEGRVDFNQSYVTFAHQVKKEENEEEPKADDGTEKLNSVDEDPERTDDR